MSDFEEMRERWRKHGLKPSGDLQKNETDVAAGDPDASRLDIPIYERDDAKSDIAREEAEESKHYYAVPPGLGDSSTAFGFMRKRQLDVEDWSRGRWVIFSGSITLTVLFFLLGALVVPEKLLGFHGILSLISGIAVMWLTWHSVDRHTRDFLRMLVPAYPFVIVGALVLYGLVSSNTRKLEEAQAREDERREQALAPKAESAEHAQWRERALPGLSPSAARFLHDSKTLEVSLTKELSGATGPELLLGFLEVRERCSKALLDAPSESAADVDRRRFEVCLATTRAFEPRIQSWADQYGRNLYSAVSEQGEQMAPLRAYLGQREIEPLLSHALASPDSDWLLHLGALTEASRKHGDAIEIGLATRQKDEDSKVRRAWIQARARLNGPMEDPCALLSALVEGGDDKAPHALADLAQHCNPELPGPKPWWLR